MDHMIYIYFALFFIGAFACFTLIYFSYNIPDESLRKALTFLLVTAGLWNTAELFKVIISTPVLLELFHSFGMVLGLSSVFFWVYFCSAFTGSDIHKSRWFWRLGLIFIVIIGIVKMTNMFHEYYMEYNVIYEPFIHLSTQPHIPHLIVLIVSYSVVLYGFYLLYDNVRGTDREPRILALLTILTIPLFFTGISITGLSQPYILAFNYEAIGVAIFAILALFISNFEMTELEYKTRHNIVDILDIAVIVTSKDGMILDINENIQEIFDDKISIGNNINDYELDDLLKINTGYYIYEDSTYRVESYPVDNKNLNSDKIITLRNVDETIERKNLISAHNEQIKGLRDVVNHEINNNIQIITGYSELISSVAEDDSDEKSSSDIITESANRLKRINSDLHFLTQTGSNIMDRDEYKFKEVTGDIVNNIQTDLSVYIEGDNSLFLNYERYKFMVERMIEFAEKNGSDTITIFCSDNKITVIDDGEYDESVDKKSIFDFGKNAPGSDTTYILPFVKTIVDIEFGHIEVDESYEKGLKYSIIIEKNISK